MEKSIQFNFPKLDKLIDFNKFRFKYKHFERKLCTMGGDVGLMASLYNWHG